MDNYYDILGVRRDADEKDIRRAFRRLARQYHPDLNPGDKEAEGKFKRINEAYEVVSDAESRKKYDKYGDRWKHADEFQARYGRESGAPFPWTYRSGDQGGFSGSDPFAGLEHLLGGFGERAGRRHRTRPRPAGAEASVDVSLEEAFSGAKRNVTITSAGKERRIEVSIPPGVDTGSVVRVTPGEGRELLLNITVAAHERFSRKGDDLFAEVDVPLEDAILGGEADVQTLNSRIRVKVPPESQNGQKIRLAGQGMPKLRSQGNRGDLYITIRPRMPKNLTGEELELVRRFKALRSRKR